METTLIFRERIDLPHFASFVLLDDPDGLEALRAYYAAYAAIADEHGVGLVLDTPTWRANADWGALLGCAPARLGAVNRRAVELLEGVRADADNGDAILISGCIGPRGDGYVGRVDERGGGAELPRASGAGLRRLGRRPRQHSHRHLSGRGGRPGPGSRGGSQFRPSSLSPSKPTAGCRTEPRSARRSGPSTTRRTLRPPTT